MAARPEEAIITLIHVSVRRANAGRVALAACAMLSLGAQPALLAQESLVQIYVVRHGETDPAADPTHIPLSDTGRQRSTLLVPTFQSVPITHLLASHTVRTRETLEAIAQARGLSIRQLPVPGSVVEGRPVTDETSRREAIIPIADALLALPSGAIALVALNSENIFAVLNRLGVPLARPGEACRSGQRCVPCLDNTCFPRDLNDQIWYVALRPGQPVPLVFSELRYGAGWVPRARP